MKSKLIFKSSVAAVLFALGIFYFVFSGKSNNIDKQELDEKSEKDTVQIDSERQKNIGIKTEQVEVNDFSSKLQLIGETEAVPDAVIDIPARVSGRITSVHFIEGDKIKKGQNLVVIDSPELAKLRSVYQTAKTKYIASEQNYERIRSLVQMHLAAKQELVDAESNLKVIQSERIAAEENLRATGLAINNEISGIYRVTAPRSGLAIMRNAIPGSQVLGSQTLTTIADMSVLWFQAKIFEGDLQFLKEGDSVKIVLNAYPDILFEGKLDHIGEKVDPVSRTIHARIVFKNIGKKAKIGLFGKANIETESRRGILIPSSAVQTYQDKHFVFLQTEPTRFLWKEVEIGTESEGRTEIKSGLAENDHVVTQGTFELKAILFKSTFGEE